MKKTYPEDFFKKAGKKGGDATKKKYGVEHYSKIRKGKKKAPWDLMNN